jgi:hypothetical protein
MVANQLRLIIGRPMVVAIVYGKTPMINDMNQIIGSSDHRPPVLHFIIIINNNKWPNQ